MYISIGNHLWPLLPSVCQNWKTSQVHRHACTSYTMRAVVYQKCKIDALLLQSRKCHMAYWIVPFAMTFSALKVIQLLKGLQVEFIKHQSNTSSSRSLSATAKPLVFCTFQIVRSFCVNNRMTENILYFDTTIFSVTSNKCIAVRKVATPLRELTCHMGSHSVTCHPAEVTFPPLPQPKLVFD